MATYNEPDLTWTENPANPNFLFAKKTERDEGAGIFPTLKTAIMNLGPDLATELGYVGDMLAHPIDTGEVLLRAAAGYAQKGLPDSWEAYLPADWATNKIYAEAINQHYIERYGDLEGAADAFAEKPVSVLLDVFIVKGILTAAARQSTKLANKINSTLNSAKGTPLEGEIATRAASLNRASNEVKAANERVVIDKGVLVFDEATGVYVPVSSVGESAKAIEAAEAAGGSVIIAGEVVHIPKPAPAVAETVAAAEVGARVSQAEIIKLADNVKAARKNSRKVEEKWMDVNGEKAMEAFWVSDVIPARAAAIRAEIARETAIRNNAIIDGKTSLVDGTERALREANIGLIAVEQDIKMAEAAEIYNNSLTLEELTAQARVYPILDEATKANIIRNTGVDESVIARNQKLAAELQAALEARAAFEATKAAELPATIKQGELFPQVVNQAQRAVDERMLSGSTKIDDAVKAETAAMTAETAEAIAAAKKAAGDMYPNVAAQTGMVTSAKANEILSTIPANLMEGTLSTVARGSPDSLSAAEIAASAAAKGGELTTLAKGGELVKSGELAAQYAKRGDMYPATIKAGELAKAGEAAAIAAQRYNMYPRVVASAVKAAETAGNLEATTGLDLQGQRGADGSFYPADIHPDISKPPVKEAAPAIKSISRPGWMQGNTHAPDDGNWWSADFDDEHWNTPAGVNEAISIWGRPIGTRHSWETPAAIQNQYTYRQKPDWSWMDEYN